MSKNEPRGLEHIPSEQSTVSDQPTTDVSAEETVTHGTSAPTSQVSSEAYRFSDHGTTHKYAPISPKDVDDVYAALVAAVDDTVAYVNWADIARVEGECAIDLCQTSISRALGLLARDEACPLTLERWSGQATTPITWRVTRPEDNQLTESITEAGDNNA